jgi:hypothetical protein
MKERVSIYRDPAGRDPARCRTFLPLLILNSARSCSANQFIPKSLPVLNQGRGCQKDRRRYPPQHQVFHVRRLQVEPRSMTQNSIIHPYGPLVRKRQWRQWCRQRTTRTRTTTTAKTRSLMTRARPVFSPNHSIIPRQHLPTPTSIHLFTVSRKADLQFRRFLRNSNL